MLQVKTGEPILRARQGSENTRWEVGN